MLSASSSSTRSSVVLIHQPQRLSPIGTLSLVTLIIQNAAVALITRQSRMGITSDKQRYHTSTVILNNEILKMVICLVFFWFERKCSSLSQFWQNLSTAIFQPDTWKLSVPAALFTLQNFLIFLSLANLDVMTFQMLSQTKLLSAAIFSVWLLHRKLNSTQWLALVILTLGVILAHVHSSSSSSSSPSSSLNANGGGINSDDSKNVLSENFVSKHLPKSFFNSWKKISSGNAGTTAAAAAVQNDINNNKVITSGEIVNFSWLGVFACIISGLSSSFAGVYFEKVVKTSAPSLAVRNIHLSLFGIPFAFFSMLVLDVANEGLSNFEFFQGYSPIVWLLVLTHAVGGLLVAAVVKYADNILKGFATALATVLSGVYAAVVWQFFPTFEFVIGCLAVFGSVLLFHYAEVKPEHNNNNSGNKDLQSFESQQKGTNVNNNNNVALSTSLLNSGGKDHHSNVASSNDELDLHYSSNNNNNNVHRSNSSHNNSPATVPSSQTQNNSTSSFFQFHHHANKRDSTSASSGIPSIKIGK